MKVKRNTLLLLTALVWGIAGANILRIGLAAYPAYLTLWNTLFRYWCLRCSNRRSLESW